MSEGPHPLTPAGWYPDPTQGDRLRYWDGTSWTHHYAPAQTASADSTGWASAGGAGQTLPGAPAPAPAVGVPPGPSGGPAQPGMSGCLKAFLIGVAAAAVGVIVLVSALVYFGGRAVHHLSTTIAGTPGRPASLPAGARDYTDERRQDRVAGPDGTVTLGSLSATATNWARTTSSTNGARLVCGDVVVRRSSVTAKDPFDAALQLAGDFAWTLVSPDGTETSYNPQSSSLSALSDYLMHGQTGNAAGQVLLHRSERHRAVRGDLAAPPAPGPTGGVDRPPALTSAREATWPAGRRVSLPHRTHRTHRTHMTAAVWLLTSGALKTEGLPVGDQHGGQLPHGALPAGGHPVP